MTVNEHFMINAGNAVSEKKTYFGRDPRRNGLITDTALSNVVTSNGYNLFGELESFEAKYSNTQYFNTVFARDSLGRIRQKTETVQGETVTEIYGYDLAGRLETVTRGGDVITYQYDDNGNRESKLVNGVAVEAGVYDDQDRLTSYNGCDYEYTDNGELRTKTCGNEVTTYDYDVLGNLLSVAFTPSLAGEGGGEEISQIEYIIDGQNRRIGKKVNGELVQGFLYADQLNPIAELNADGSIRSRFVYGAKINVPDYMIRDGVTYRIISDHLGSPRLVINAADGSVAQRMDYDEFGNVALDTNPGFQPFGFAGGIYDRQTGLVRFGARDYSAEIGRWLSKDPILFDGGVNLYEHTFNDPINFLDVNGAQGYWANVAQNFNTTNAAVPGRGLLPTGVGLATAGITANSIGGITVVGALGFYGTSQFGGALLFAGFTSTVNVLAVGGVWQFGILVGSMVNAIPTGCGRTVRDSVTDVFEFILG